MRVCQLFSLAVVALSMVTLSGCATPATLKATGLTEANSPITHAMESAGQATYKKRAE